MDKAKSSKPTHDRDGRATVEGLRALVDEVCRIAQGQYTFEPGTPPESEE